MGVDGWIHKFGTFVPNKSCYYFEGFPKMMLKQFLIEQSGVSGALVQGAGGETSLQFWPKRTASGSILAIPSSSSRSPLTSSSYWSSHQPDTVSVSKFTDRFRLSFCLSPLLAFGFWNWNFWLPCYITLEEWLRHKSISHTRRLDPHCGSHSHSHMSPKLLFTNIFL